MALEVRLLGLFSVRRGGEEIPAGAFGGRLVRKMLRVLVTRRGQFVSHDLLAEALWPEKMPLDPTANLKVLVNRARRALGDPSMILTGPGGYSFVRDDRSTVDAERFLAAVGAGTTEAAKGGDRRVLQHLSAALDLWAGEPLAEDLYDDWARDYRSALWQARLHGLEHAARAALGLGEASRAVVLAQEATAQSPYRENACLLLAEALAAGGDSVAALRALHDIRVRLAEDLGLDPSAEIAALEARLLRGEVSTSRASDVRAPVTGTTTFGELAFVGRESELTTILTALPEPGALALVSGPAGSGKSRLLREVNALCERPVITARAFLPERDEAWSLARSLIPEALSLDVATLDGLPEWAAEALADVCPEVAELRPLPRGTIDAASRRALALQAAVRLMESVAGTGAVMLVDDLQWSDATSLNLMSLIAARVPGLSLVVAYRPEEVGRDSAAASFLHEAHASTRRATAVPLGGLSSEAVSRLFAEDPVSRAVTDATEGDPLAIAETVRALQARHLVAPDAEGRWHVVAEGVVGAIGALARDGKRRSIHTRALAQPPSRREVLELLALLDREVPAQVLASATGLPQVAVLDDLEALARTGLVRLGNGGWATAHDLVAEIITDGLRPGGRGRLHDLLARALGQHVEDRAEVARHQAGAGDRAAASVSFAEAARQRLGSFAGEEARVLAESGLALAASEPVRSELFEVRAAARELLGDISGARDDLRGALASHPSGPDRSRLLTRVALLMSSDDLVEAAEVVDVALREAGDDACAAAEALAVAAIIDVNLNRMDAAGERGATALALFERLGDPRGMATVVDARAVGALYQGRVYEAAAELDRAARLYRDAGSLLRVGMPQSLSAWALMLTGDAERALDRVERALDLERMLGQLEGEAFCYWAIASVLTALGRDGEAVETAERGLVLNRQVGSRVGIGMSLYALGMAVAAVGSATEAETFLQQAVEEFGSLVLHRSFSTALLGSLALARDDPDSAESYAARCLAEGCPLSGYEARLVLAEIEVLEGRPGAEAEARGLLDEVQAAGYVTSTSRARLQERVAWHPGTALAH